MMLAKLSLRNLRRNPRRTFLNLIMIAGGFTAIVMFRGFSSHLIGSLQRSAVDNQFGHMQVAKTNYWEPVADDSPKDRALKNSDVYIQQLSGIKDLEYVSGRISFFGLISSGDRTVSAQFVGFDPEKEVRMKNALNIIKGSNFDKNDVNDMALAGKGIIKQIGGQAGQDLTILAHTRDGAINAIDINLKGIFQTTVSEIDDTTIFLPLKTVQKLLDTDDVDRLIMMFDDEINLEAKVFEAQSKLPPELKARSWKDLSDLFRQVEEYYKVNNRVIEAIILALVLLSISNTVGMSIFERTGEIGTLRAMGDTSSDVIKGFCLEGLFLGILGAILGCVLAFVLSNVVSWVDIRISIPGASVPVSVQIIFLPMSYLYAGVLASITSILATYFPSRKISKMGIVEALRHNI
jgi:putative ABC transport system permease protein